MLLDSLERYGLYLSLAADDVETRRASQDENVSHESSSCDCR